jgi:hypothetical protein
MLSYDRPWWAGISFLFSILEVNTGLICACVATLNPVTTLFFTRVKDWTSDWTGKSSQQSKYSQSQPSDFSRPSKGQVELGHDLARFNNGAYAQEQQQYVGSHYTTSTRNNSVGAATDSTDRLYKEDFDQFPSPELGNMPSPNPGDHFAQYDLHGLQALEAAHKR